MNTTIFNVPSISCSACSDKIQDSLNSLQGIESVNIDLKSQTVTVKYNEENTSPQEIRKAISSIGYEVIQ